MTKQPDIHDYVDFKSFVRDRLRAMGETQKSLAGVLECSAAYVSLILNKKRILTEEYFQLMCRFFTLSTSETEHLSRLLAIHQGSPQEKAEAQTAAIEAQNNHYTHTMTPEEFTALCHWFSPVLLELIKLEGFQEDPDWIQQHVSTPISPEQITESTRVLLRIGLLKRASSGTLFPTHQTLRSRPPLSLPATEITSLLIQQQQDFIELARRSLTQVSPNEREYGTMTIAVPKDGFAEIQSTVREFQERIAAISERQLTRENAGPGRVYLLNVQLFPLTAPNH